MNTLHAMIRVSASNPKARTGIRAFLFTPLLDIEPSPS